MLYLNNGYLNSSAIKIKMLLHRDINILARFYTVFVISLLLARYSNGKTFFIFFNTIRDNNEMMAEIKIWKGKVMIVT